MQRLTHLAGVSLNRTEQRLFDYVSSHPEEKQYWMRKVRNQDFPAALERALWDYYVERSQVVPALREAAAREGLQRTSLRNLAEFLLRLWTAPRARPSKPEDRKI